MLQVLFKFHHFPHLCPLSIPGSNPGSPTAFRFLVSSVLWSIALPQFLFVFHDLNIFEDYWSLFCRMFLNLGLSDLSSWLDRGHAFCAFSVHEITDIDCHMMSLRLIIGAINFHHLVQVMSARFFHCKVSTFLFVVNNYVGEDTMRLCTYIVSLQTFAHWF